MKKIIFNWLFKSVIQKEIEAQEKLLVDYNKKYKNAKSQQGKASAYALKNQVLYAIKVLIKL